MDPELSDFMGDMAPADAPAEPASEEDEWTTQERHLEDMYNALLAKDLEGFKVAFRACKGYE